MAEYAKGVANHHLPEQPIRYWYVERPCRNKGGYPETTIESIHAASAQILDCGVLVLRNGKGKVAVAYALGQWLTVTEEDDE